jgi:DNA polymerase-3 subunit epsilon
VEHFFSLHEGVNLLLSLAGKFGIDQRFCHYGTPNAGEFIIKKDTINLPDVKQHNAKVEQALDYLIGSKQSFGIVDKGRAGEERSCIWVENGHFYGMGYMPSDVGITEAIELKDYVTPYHSNRYIMQLITGYAEKYPGKVLRAEVPVEE